MNRLRSALVETLSAATGSVKLGQPVPESYLALLSKSGWPQQTQT
jgi:hypothetical protein